MPVSFLDLVPKLPTRTITINTRTGPAEVELSGISLRALADIAKRYPNFRRVVEGDLGSITDEPEVMAAMIAASLGHLGDAEWEKRVEQLSAADAVRMAATIVQITFAQSEPDPLADVPAAVVGDGLDQSSPSLLSN